MKLSSFFISKPETIDDETLTHLTKYFKEDVAKLKNISVDTSNQKKIFQVYGQYSLVAELTFGGGVKKRFETSNKNFVENRHYAHVDQMYGDKGEIPR